MYETIGKLEHWRITLEEVSPHNEAAATCGTHWII